MANDRKSSIERLFNRYASNLSMYEPDVKDVFVCPLCLRYFNHDDDIFEALSLEHIVPQKLGGRLETLTCKECNNQSGTKLESNLVQRLRIKDILEGYSKEPLRGEISVADGKSTVDIFLPSDEQPLIIKGLPKWSNPTLHHRVSENFDSGISSFSLSASLAYREGRSRVATIKSAYLLMFHYFGYGYIRYNLLDGVRSQIQNPTNETIILNGGYWFPQVLHNTHVITVLSEPQDLRCFLVILNLSTRIERNVGIVMPGLEVNGEQVYASWSNVNSDMNIKYGVVKYNPSFLTDPQYKNLPLRLWNESTHES